MNYVLKPFEKFISSVISVPADEAKHCLLYELLSKKTERLKRVMLRDLLSQQNGTIQVTYFNVHMQKLVVLCDQLFDYEKQHSLPNEYSLLVLNVLALSNGHYRN
jgi:hypothetical protein